MPNSNVIDRLVGAGSPAQGVKAVPTITLTATTEKQFLDQTGAVATVSAMPQSGPSANGSFDGFAFKVRATFKVTTGGTSTNVFKIYVGNSSTISNNTAIASVTSDSLATASSSGFLEATLIWDNTSQKLNGIQSGAYGAGSAISAVAIANTNISIASLSKLVFSATSTNGSSVTGTTVTLTEFVVEAV